MAGLPRTFKVLDCAREAKEAYKCYPNALDPKYLNKERERLEGLFPGWYQFLRAGDRVKLSVPGNTPATRKKTCLTFGEILSIEPFHIFLLVDSWSGFGTYHLTLNRCSKERILWHGAGTQARIQKRRKRYKEILAQPAPSF